MLEHTISALMKKMDLSSHESPSCPWASVLLLGIVLLLIPGCVSSGKSAKKTLAVKETNVLNMKIEHYYDGDYFVHIAKDGGKWHVVDVMTAKPKDFDSKDELVSFNRAMTVTGPAFHHKMPENIIGCTAFDGASSTYTICNSEFGDANVQNTALITVMTLGISAACGGGYAVSFDEEEYAEIVKESGAIERIQAFIDVEKGKALAAAAAMKKLEDIPIKPEITDDSGCFKGTWQGLLLAQYTISSPDKSLGGVLGTLQLKDRKKSVLEGSYDFSVDTRSYQLTAQTTEVRPQIHISKFQPKRWHINRTFANEDIAMDVKKVSADNGWVNFFYDIRNVSNNYINMISKQFYIERDIANDDIPQQLPPQAMMEKKESLARQSNMQYVINLPVDKSNMDKQFRLAVAINYTVNGQQKTMFAEQYVRLGDML